MNANLATKARDDDGEIFQRLKKKSDELTCLVEDTIYALALGSPQPTPPRPKKEVLDIIGKLSSGISDLNKAVNRLVAH